MKQALTKQALMPYLHELARNNYESILLEVIVINEKDNSITNFLFNLQNRKDANFLLGLATSKSRKYAIERIVNN